MRAQELMAKYKLSEKDLNDSSKKDKELCRYKSPYYYTSRGRNLYLARLINVLGDAYCCVGYISTPRRTQSHFLVFLGYKSDIEVLRRVLDMIVSRVNNSIEKIYKEYDGYPASYINNLIENYTKAYVIGLKESLQSQQDAHKDWGLVLVKPKEATEFLNNLSKPEYQVKNNYSSYNPDMYNKGYHDGSSFADRLKLEA